MGAWLSLRLSASASSARDGSVWRPDLNVRGFFGRRDPLFDEGVPLVAVRALPEQFGRAIAAAQADVRVEIEDGVAGEPDVAGHQRRRQVEGRQRFPDRLMQRERM